MTTRLEEGQIAGEGKTKRERGREGERERGRARIHRREIKEMTEGRIRHE
jgi:hypothetical protein